MPSLTTLLFIFILLNNLLWMVLVTLIWVHFNTSKPVPVAARIVFTLTGKKGFIMNLKANDQLPVSLQAADEFGNPTAANFDSPPSWSSSDASVVAVAAAADGLSAVLSSPAGKLSGATVQVAGTVGGVAVQGSLQLTVVAGDTAEITLVPGTPVAVPAPAAG